MLDIEDYQWAKNVLKKLDFFSHCSEEDILGLVENLEKQNFKTGSTILFQGEISNRFHIIRKGTVGIFKAVSGEKKMVAELSVEKYFGEISLMTPTSATATVKAVSNVEIISLSYESLEFAFRKHPEELKTIQKKIEERKQGQTQPTAPPS